MNGTQTRLAVLLALSALALVACGGSATESLVGPGGEAAVLSAADKEGPEALAGDGVCDCNCHCAGADCDCACDGTGDGPGPGTCDGTGDGPGPGDGTCDGCDCTCDGSNCTCECPCDGCDCRCDGSECTCECACDGTGPHGPGGGNG